MRGFIFPLRVSKDSLLESSEINSSFESSIKSKIKMLITTGQSSRPYCGDYGIGLEKVFSMLGGNVNSFKQDLVDKVNKFIPEVNLSLTDVTIEADSEGKLGINITYPERDLDLMISFQLF
jgi:phage baseplate assembly protein W